MMLDFLPISLGLRSDPARYGQAGACRLINGYLEVVGEAGKHQAYAHACDGFSLFSTLTNGGGVSSALALSDAEMYVKAGRLIFRVDGGGSSSVVGGMPTDGFSTMARNRAATPQIAVVGDGLYFKIEGGVLTQLADPDLPPPVSVCEINGYFIFMLADGRLFSSELDGIDVSALDYAAASSRPDGGVIAWKRGQDLLAGGTETIEAWADQGLETFPLARVTNVKRAEDDKDIGVLSGPSVAESFFVASDRTVRQISGYQAVRVSNHALERLIKSEASPHTISGTTWSIDGHTFYCISGTNWTWCYDSSPASKVWHERKSYAADRWKVALSIPFGDRILFGDYASPKLYLLDSDTFTEAGDHLIMTVQTPTVHGAPYRMRHNALRLDMIMGVGLVSATDSLANPHVMMDYSDDGGANWSTQRSATLGAAGDSLRQVQFNRLGVTRSRTYRISVSAAVARSIADKAYLAAEKLAA